MLTISKRTTSEATRREITTKDGFRYHKSEWLSSGEDPRLSPTIFLVEQPPHSVLRPHFHSQNEFQVFVRGSGWMGKSEVHPLVVHYAAAYTGYGPITAGPDGLAYFTIRSVYESGAMFVPEDREKMVSGPRHQYHVGPLAALDGEALRDLPAPVRREIARAKVGTSSISLLQLPPHASVPSELLGANAAVFNMVIGGSLVHDGYAVAPWEMLVGTQDDPPFHVCAGAGGAELLVMVLDARDATFGG